MTPLPDWLQPLQFLTRPFPAAAMAEAIERREEATPHLLHALEWAEQNVDQTSGQPLYMLHLFAMYLLAQFRETQAHPLIIRLFRHPRYEELTGDMVVEGLPGILASTCGGDTRLMEEMVVDRDLDEWVRSAGLGALWVLVDSGSKSRDEFSAYIGRLLAGGIEREPHFLWDALAETCLTAGLTEHLEEIRRAYREGLVEPEFLPLETLEARIGLRSDRNDAPNDHLQLIDDAIAELKGWHCFTREAEQEELRGDFDDDYDPLPDDEPLLPLVRDSPKIGRNAECPCGSGKKYKKCCGQAGAN